MLLIWVVGLVPLHASLDDGDRENVSYESFMRVVVCLLLIPSFLVRAVSKGILKAVNLMLPTSRRRCCCG